MTLFSGSSPLYLAFAVVVAIFNYRNTERYRRYTGRSPWGIHPVVWGVATVFFSLVVTILALIAMNTGRGRVGRTYGSRPGPRPTGDDWRYRPPAPPGAPAEEESDLLPAERWTYAGTPTHPSADRAPTQASAPPSWQPDPSGRFDHRYWDGDEWTEFVSKDGVQSSDPF